MTRIVTGMTLLAACGLAAGDERKSSTDEKIGRPVRVVSISIRKPVNRPMAQMLPILEREAAKGCDLIVLPETWRGSADDAIEPVDGPTTQALAKIAAKHKTYIVNPIHALVDGKRLNTGIVIDRNGEIAGRYDKVYPFWNEFEYDRPVEPGDKARVIDCDFGKLGITICFDANFPEVWQQLEADGAEIVVWPSAYSGGDHLQAYALLFHYYIVTSTHWTDCLVFDITGKKLLDEKSDDINVSRITLDLDRGIYKRDYNHGKRAALLEAHGDEVELEEVLDRESWFVLRATKPGVSVQALAAEYGIEPLRDYIRRSRCAIDGLRDKPIPPVKDGRFVEKSDTLR